MSDQHIHPDLEALAIDIDTLEHDPRNARTHDEENLQAIEHSLREHGQRKPIVVQVTDDGRRIVRAGNGTMEAAKRMGWTQLAAVQVHEDDEHAMAFALRDNRTAELAAWDFGVLSGVVHDLEMADIDTSILGWSESDLTGMQLASAWDDHEVDGAAAAQAVRDKATVVRFVGEEIGRVERALMTATGSAKVTAEAVLQVLEKAAMAAAGPAE